MNTHDTRRDTILDDAITVFGRLGFRKASMNEVASAAGISKPGLYLYYAGKEELFRAAMAKYLDDCFSAVKAALADESQPLPARLSAAMEAWFGRHLITFTAYAIDTIEAGDRVDGLGTEKAISAFRTAIADAFARSGAEPEAARQRAEVLFLCGLSWKQPGMTPERFRLAMASAISVCCASLSDKD